MKKFIVPAIVVFSACSGASVPTKSTATAPAPALTSDQLHRIATQRVFFGHQSVGYNILEGVGDVLRAQPHPVNLRIAEGADPSLMAPGVLAHATVGKNGEPITKIQSFASALDSGLGAKTDVALFKFCYIDVDASTDVEGLFNEYQKVMAGLKQRHPSVRFVHVTMPLRKVQTGPKALLKKALSKPPGGFLENIRRNKYNEMLRRQYGQRETIFDLAQVEAAVPDGAATTFTYGGEEFLALNPAFTYDNGHLNETGRRLVAERFLAALADAGATK